MNVAVQNNVKYMFVVQNFIKIKKILSSRYKTTSIIKIHIYYVRH
jgi:hypothetical protein